METKTKPTGTFVYCGKSHAPIYWDERHTERCPACVLIRLLKAAIAKAEAGAL